MQETIKDALAFAARQYRHIGRLNQSKGFLSASDHFEALAKKAESALELLDRAGPGFDLTFSAENDAFAQEPENQVAEILRQIAESVEAGNCAGSVRDQNGNTCGNWSFSAPGD